MDSTDPPAGYLDDGDNLNELTRLLLSTESFEDFLTELVHYASAQTEHTCSITVRTEDREPYTVVSTDELTLRLDEHQYADGNGPCLEALSTHVPVFVVDMATEVRWPPYPAQAAALGVRSSMSYPLITGEAIVGALNMYAFTELEPDVGRNARAAQLADRAAGALAVGMRLAEQSSENANLRVALSSRTVIDQAIGVLMAQQQCSTEDAFAILRKASQGRNIKLRDVAAQIVASVQRRAPGKPGGRY
jgi:transcriptional regulator with GAF, ATPase, and Fis domain